jgi:hypothetical protein
VEVVIGGGSVGIAVPKRNDLRRGFLQGFFKVSMKILPKQFFLGNEGKYLLCKKCPDPQTWCF